jgi:hypothetical protein
MCAPARGLTIRVLACVPTDAFHPIEFVALSRVPDCYNEMRNVPISHFIKRMQ